MVYIFTAKIPQFWYVLSLAKYFIDNFDTVIVSESHQNQLLYFQKGLQCEDGIVTYENFKLSI